MAQPAGPAAVAVGASDVCVVNTLDGTVSRIDPGADAVVQTIHVGAQPSDLALAAGSVWVANRDEGTFSRIHRRLAQPHAGDRWWLERRLYPTANDFIGKLTCAYFVPGSSTVDSSDFCDPAFDRSVAHAAALQTTNPPAAARLWVQLDRELADRAVLCPQSPLKVHVRLCNASSRAAFLMRPDGMRSAARCGWRRVQRRRSYAS